MAVSLALLVTMAAAAGARAATSVGLGTADSYAVLAGSGVTNTGPSVIDGDLGTSPTPAVTGFGGAPNGTVNGAIHQGDAAAAQAKGDLTTAYDNAAGQGPEITLATELGGQTLTPGVYVSQSGTFGITGTLTLNAQGNPDAVFIFKTATTLVTASSSRVAMINGAQSCHLFWKVGSSATLGTSSTFAGNILALLSISLNNGVSVDGRLLARNGAVTLINDTVTRAACSTAGGGGGGGGGGGTGGGGTGGGKNGNGGGGANGERFVVQIGVPSLRGPRGGPDTPGRNARCTDTGFRARLNIRHRRGMRSIKVYVGGKLIKQGRNKRMTFWVNVSGLRAGRNTIRVVAVDRTGRRASSSRQFRRCAPALAAPKFTG
jgi:hypothetical protein